jgi:SAM-dependent methyltransferase
MTTLAPSKPVSAGNAAEAAAALAAGAAAADVARMDDNFYRLLNEIPETYWRYVARHELFLGLWRKFRARKDRHRVLDVGCGTGALLSYFCQRENIEPIGVDLFLDTLHHCRTRGINRVAAADATRLPFPDGAFDFVITQDVMEHVPDEAKMADELHRVCAPGGLVLVLVPAHKWLWSTRDIRLHHCRRYQLSRLKKVVAKTGLEPVHATYTDSFLIPPMWACLKLAKKTPEGVPDLTADAPGNAGIVNAVFRAVARTEAGFARRMGIPTGVAATVLARKPMPR